MAANTTDRTIVADASKVSARDFLAHAIDAFFPPRPKTRVSEKADAAERFLSRVWGASRDEAAAMRAAYQAELAEIDARYDEAESLAPVTRLGPGRIAA